MGEGGKVTLEYVPVSKLQTYWPLAAPLIEKARRRYDHEYGLDDVLAALRAGRALLWIIRSDAELVAAMTTTEELYPRRKSMLIELLGGHRVNEWAHDALAQIAQIARDVGYDAIETRGRLGWGRLAKQNNFKVKHVAYEMEL